MQFREHPCRRPWVCEGSRADLHGAGTSEEQLDRMVAAAYAADPDESKLR